MRGWWSGGWCGEVFRDGESAALRGGVGGGEGVGECFEVEGEVTIGEGDLGVGERAASVIGEGID